MKSAPTKPLKIDLDRGEFEVDRPLPIRQQFPIPQYSVMLKLRDLGWSVRMARRIIRDIQAPHMSRHGRKRWADWHQPPLNALPGPQWMIVGWHLASAAIVPEPPTARRDLPARYTGTREMCQRIIAGAVKNCFSLTLGREIEETAAKLDPAYTLQPARPGTPGSGITPIH